MKTLEFIENKIYERYDAFSLEIKKDLGNILITPLIIRGTKSIEDFQSVGYCTESETLLPEVQEYADLLLMRDELLSLQKESDCFKHIDASLNYLKSRFLCMDRQ